MKKLLLVIGLLTLSSITPGLIPQKAYALSGSDFQAGRIMDDGVFFNGASLSPDQIQQFLNAKVPVCDTNGSQAYGGTTRAAYGASRGYPAPFTCMKDFRQDTPTKATDGLCNNYAGGNKTASQIIYDVGVSCGISQRALIVLLEKEQSLVTDDWPWSIQYRSATGYGCPDTAPCDAEYYGFFNQVYNAAHQFKRYGRDANLFNFRPARTSYVQYNPNASCGGTDVFITNQTTAGLYNYTPYQPNPSALASLYGSGDGCGAYGNRNFWRLYSDWFGTTYAQPFTARFYRQSDHPSITQGSRSVMFFDYKNFGSAIWTDDTTTLAGGYPVHLATSGPMSRISNFAAGWPTGNRPVTNFSVVYESDGSTLAADQHRVYPGQIARFAFNAAVPSTYPVGTYREQFQPILEGAPQWYMEGVAWLDITATKAYDAQFTGQSSYPTLNPGSTTTAYFTYKNTGGLPWYDTSSVPNGGNPVNLATTAPINRSSKFGSTWFGSAKDRPAVRFKNVYEANGVTPTSNQAVVWPGQIAKFEFVFTVPFSTAPGLHREFFQPILEGSTGWNFAGPAWLDINVTTAQSKATYYSQSPYPTVARGGTTTASFMYKNTGGTTWYDSASAPSGLSALNLATTNPINRSSPFGATWFGSAKDRPAVRFKNVYEADGVTAAADQTKVLPGQISRYEFVFTIPNATNPGVHREFFQPILEGSTGWSVGGVVWLDITVI